MSEVPIYKVGLVLLRDVGTAEPKVLLVRPKPKDPKETNLPWVLPRGTREYKENGVMKPVKDDAAAVKFASRLEPLTSTLLREAEEEAGVPPALLRDLDVRQLGAREYVNSHGRTLRIHWYAAAIDGGKLSQLKPPTDALRPPYWEKVSALESLAGQKQLNTGYAQVAKEALAGIQAGTWDKAAIPKEEKGRGGKG